MKLDPNLLKITARLIYFELQSRGIEVKVLSAETGWMCFKDSSSNWHYLQSTLSDKEYAQAFLICQDKYMTMEFCRRLNIPHPKTLYAHDPRAATLLSEFSKVVVKPLNGSHGNGISTGVDSTTKLDAAIKIASRYSSEVLVQQEVAGDDYRLLFIDGAFVAALQRTPACVYGDGVNTVRELIELENQNPDRGEDFVKPLLKISLETAYNYLHEKIDSVPSAGEKVQVVGVANISSGGNARDVTDIVPASMVSNAKLLIDELRMGICGVDYVWTGKPEDVPYLIELNATPGIDVHDNPLFGTPRGVIAKFVDYVLA